MEEIFAAILSMLLVAMLIPLYLWRRRQDTRSLDEHHHQDEPQAPRRETVSRSTATRRMRRRPAAGDASSSRAVETSGGDNLDESDDEAVGGEFYEAKASKKRRRSGKSRRHRDRCILSLLPKAEEASREARQTKFDRYAEMRKRKDEEREAKERMLEEEAKVQKAKEDEAAAFEFEKWKGKCINRITSTKLWVWRLSGVMDDRGKYIYISLEEMKAVADYIKRLGRVSISHLASKSNQFIDLEPKAQYVEEISNVEEMTAT
ncbi:hypothetical protein K2173_003090 [Erythroxylum novogranatense]|uniref:DDRGK domain-containing protein 1 n=1 Tax=Erythroxylum novogranatense TaxID=1862640 RepID=A0AAV8TAA8_9ROSI|nr:hypothetical protein K2173_003090 [Erythroxylum novogranatense]